MLYEGSAYDKFDDLSRVDVRRLTRSLKAHRPEDRARAADDLAALGSGACSALTELAAILLNNEEQYEFVRVAMRAAFEAISEAVQAELNALPKLFKQLPLVAA